MRDGLLFLCVANSARSQMAEGLARQLVGGRVRVWSAGSEPASLNPYAVRAMAEVGIDIGSHVSKGIAEIPQERVAVVVTLCAEEVCPVFPGEVVRHHWPLPDPAAVEGTDAERLEAFGRVRDQLRERLEAWLSTSGLPGLGTPAR